MYSNNRSNTMALNDSKKDRARWISSSIIVMDQSALSVVRKDQK